MPKPLIACVVFLVVALAAGCGGGGSGGLTPVAGPGRGAGTASSTVTIAIPPKPADALAKAPAYVSPNTASIGIVVTPQGGTAYPAVIANVPGSSCTPVAGGGYTCSIVVTASYGVDSLAITAYSAANAGGSVLSSGTITSTFSPSASPGPALDVVLTGVVKGIAMSIVHNTVQDGYVPVGQGATLNVTALDASGAIIIGTYDGPIAVALPANSGLSLGTTSFADSTHTTSSITWNGAPTHFAAPTATVTITASATGGAVTGSVKFHPLTTLLSIPAGDGGANAMRPFGLVHSGTSFVVGTASQTFGDGEIASFDPSTGAQSVSGALGYHPNALYRDAKFGGIWVSDSAGGAGVLHCYASPASADAPVPVPTAGASHPTGMVLDGSDRLWFASDNNVAYVTVSGACATSSTFASYRSLPYNFTTPFGAAVVADRSVDTMWAVDSANRQIDQFYNGNSTGTPIAALFPSSAGYDGADDVVIGGLDGTTLDGVLQIIPQDSTAFSSTYELYANANVAAIDAIHSGADGAIATADGDYGGLGIYYPAATGLSTFVPLPQYVGYPASYCAGVAFDGAGMPWGACRLAGHATLERLILTSDWSAFEDADTLRQGNQAELGVAGGTATMTFTLVCSSGLTCAPDASEPRVFRIHANAVGPATVTVNGSDGRSQTFAFTVGPNVS
jgi:hypothetical protein